MQFYSDPHTIQQLQSGAITVLLYDKTKQEEVALLNDLKGIVVVRAVPKKEQLLLESLSSPQEKASQEIIAVKTPPSGHTILWSAHEKDVPAMEAIVATLNSAYSQKRFSIGCGTADALKSKVIDLLLTDNQLYTRRATQLNAAIAQIRQEHELTRKVLHNMQDILWNVRGNPPRQTFFTKLGRNRISLDTLKQHNVTGFSQKLVIQSKGLAGIDIYISEKCDYPGVLICTLLAASTGEVLAQWKDAYSSLDNGWLHLPLSTILAQNNLGLELIVSFVSPYNDSPAIGLTDDVVSGAEYIKINGNVQQGAMLAMRTWGGFPGIRNESIKGRLPCTDDSTFFEYQIPITQLNQLRLTVDHNAGFPCLNVDNQGVILLHPLFNVEMSAYIPNSLPRGLCHIEAEVVVNGDCPSRTEFAIAAVEPHSDVSTITPTSKECVASSGWVPVSANFSRELIGFTLSEPYFKGDLDLYIFTRTPKDHSVDYCQAQFTSIKIGVSMNKATTIVESPIVQAYALPNEAELPEAVIPCDKERLQEARLLYDFSVNFTPFEILPNRSLLLHPILNKHNIAVIPLAVPASTTSIIADIRVGKKCIEDVQFGMFILKEGVTFDKARPFDLHDDTLYMSTKIIGLKENAATLRLDLPAALQGATDLYLFTTLPANRTMDFATSYFDNIRYVVS
jgi:hypothetical protein